MRFEDALLKFKSGKAKYTILGDSITDTWCGGFKSSGGASDGAHGYPQILHAMLQEKYGKGVSFDNLGYGGNTLAEAASRVEIEIFTNNYDLIGIALGTNDWNQQKDLTIFQSQYIDLVETLRQLENSAIFLVTLGYFGDWRKENRIRETEYNRIIFEIGKKYDIPVVDTRKAMLDYMTNNHAVFDAITYLPDPVHPNDLGHKIWADECYKLF